MSGHFRSSTRVAALVLPLLGAPVSADATVRHDGANPADDASAARPSAPPDDGAPAASGLLRTPRSLRSVVYSPRHPLGYSSGAAELFWARQGPGQRFAVRREGEVVKVTDGISHFFAPALEDETWEVLAIDDAGNASAPARIVVGSDGPSIALETPRGLRSVLYSPRDARGYSDGAAELFWERQGPGQRFEVRREGETVTVTDGTSHFFAPALVNETWEVLAVDDAGNASAPARVVALPSIVNDLLDADLAEPVLRDMISIANGGFFDQFLPIVSEELGELIELWTPDSTVVSSSYAMIEGSGDEPVEGDFGGFDGGRYTCLAGGAVALPVVFGGELGDAFLIRFDRCVTLSETLGASVTLDGQVRVLPGGIRGSTSSSERYTNFTAVGDELALGIDGTYAVNISGRGGRSVGDVERTVTLYTRITGDGLDETVSDYRSRRTVNVAGGQDPTRTARAEIGFSASTPATNLGPDGLTLRVDIDLGYDGSGEPAAGRVDQWDSGSLVVEAIDGSRIRAEPIADDPTTLRIVVDDVSFERPWSEGYQIDCAGELSGCR